MDVPSRFYVRRLVTVPGAHSYSHSDLQRDFSERLRRLPNVDATLETVKTIYENSAVQTRHFEISVPELDRLHATSDSHPIVNEALLSLGRRTLEALFSQGLTAKDCDGLIVVASNFDGFPGMSRRLAETLGFRDDVYFYDLSGLACGGASHGIGLANLLLETGRCKTVALVCMDVIGTFNQLRRFDALPTTGDIVGRVLSSDGAAGMVFSTEPGPGARFSYRRFDWKLHAWPESVNYAVTRTSPNGEPYGAIGKEIRTRMLAESAAMLTDEVVQQPIFIHPGGIALLRELAKAMPSLRGSVELSTEILAGNGNLSSPTVLFVLARALERGAPIQPNLRLLAFGPGIYTTLSCFSDARAA